MTNDNIKKVQIIAECDNGQYLISVSDNRVIIGLIAEFCKFARLKDELFEQCNLEKLIKK